MLAINSRNRLAAAFLTVGALGAGAVHSAPAHAAVCSGESRTLAQLGVPAFEAQVVCLTNNARSTAHLAPLAVHPALTSAARKHSQDMVRRHFFAHTSPSPNSTTPAQRIAAAGYPARAWGENIRWIGGSPTPKQVVDGWLASERHRNNILSVTFKEVGVGAAVGTPFGGAGGTFTQDFGTR